MNFIQEFQLISEKTEGMHVVCKKLTVPLKKGYYVKNLVSQTLTSRDTHDPVSHQNTHNILVYFLE